MAASSCHLDRFAAQTTLASSRPRPRSRAARHRSSARVGAIRVLLDTTYARRAPFSGTAVYLTRLQQALAAEPRVDVVALANARRRPPAGGGAGSVRNLLTDTVWTSVELPRRARRRRADLIHHPLPARSPVSPVPQVVTVLDLAFERLPHLFATGYRRFAHRTHRAAALRAAAVICISETTARDVRELWRVPQERIVVALLGPGQDLGGPVEPRQPPAHFLYVGDAEPRKNLPVLLAAHRLYRARAREPLELVVAGSARVAPEPGVRLEAAPGPQKLRSLLAGAAALVHPSLYEGFGLTPLEAMSAGTPVIAARSPGIVEVCGDAACYADPHRPPEFAAAMAQIAADPAARAELSRRGLERAARFSWAGCARCHAEAYSLALGA